MTSSLDTSPSQHATPALAIVVGIASAMATQIMPLMVVVFSRVFELSSATAGRITALEMLGVCAGSLLVAALLSRTRVSRLMGASLGLIVVGNLLTIVGGAGVLPVVRFVAGLGAGAGTGAMAAVLAGTSAPVRYFAIFIIGCFAIATVLFRFDTTITAAAGPFATFWILGALAVLAVPAALLTTAAESGAHDNSRPVSSQGRTALAAIALLALVLYLAGWTNMWAYAVNIGQWSGLTAEGSNGILGYAVIAGAVGAIIAAVIGSRFGNFLPLLVAGSVMLAAAALIGLRLTPGTFTIAALAWVGGMQFIGSYFLGVVSMADPEGRAASLAIAAQTFGIAVGPAIGSTVVGRGDAALLAGISIALLLPSLAALLLIERRFGRPVRSDVAGAV